MSKNIDFKEIWGKQQTAIPEKKELLKKADHFKRKNLNKIILANITLLFTSIFIGFIWYYYQPDIITTKIGIVLVILSMLLFLGVYNTLIPFLLKKSNEINIHQYLNQLIRFKKKQSFIQNIIMHLYFLLLSLGLGLYMYEFIIRMPLTWALLSCTVVILWIGINWFYFRPRIIKKQQHQINTLIKKFESYTEQLQN